MTSSSVLDSGKMESNSDGKVGLDPSQNKKPGILETPKNLYKEDLFDKNNTYKIMIEKPYSVSDRFQSISKLKIAEHIYKVTKGKNILEVKKIGRNRIIVECTCPATANHIVKTNNSQETGVEAYIPLFWTTRAGVIRDVDSDYDENILKEAIECFPFTINSIRRINRRISTEEGHKFVPSTSVQIFFDGQKLPEYVNIWNARFICEPYVRRSVQCYKCLRYGHSSLQCKGKLRCSKCGQFDHERTSCITISSEHKCINCNEDHEATDRNCQEKKRQQNINTLMANRNLSYQEASLELPAAWKSKYSFSTIVKNKYEVLANYDKDFPSDRLSGYPLKTSKPSVPEYRPPPIIKGLSNKQKNVEVPKIKKVPEEKVTSRALINVIRHKRQNTTFMKNSEEDGEAKMNERESQFKLRKEEHNEMKNNEKESMKLKNNSDSSLMEHNEIEMEFYNQSIKISSNNNARDLVEQMEITKRI